MNAVEKGVMVTESDPTNRSVGLAGLPDRDGFTTLDACIMDHESRCGSVAFLQNIEHPIAVARLVMEETPHVMLVGEGAYEFALSKGFTRKEFLDEKSKAEVAKAYACGPPIEVVAISLSTNQSALAWNLSLDLYILPL